MSDQPLTRFQWLIDYAESIGITYHELMEAAEAYLKNGDYLCDGGKFEGECLPDVFWDHYEAMRAEIVEEKNRGSFFSCSC